MAAITLRQPILHALADGMCAERTMCASGSEPHGREPYSDLTFDMAAVKIQADRVLSGVNASCTLRN